MDNPGRRYPPPEHYMTICPHTEKYIVETPAPHCWVDEGDHEARRSWRAEFRAFTDAWREALAAWVCQAPHAWGQRRAGVLPAGWLGAFRGVLRAGVSAARVARRG